jgi:hypothetical protein
MGTNERINIRGVAVAILNDIVCFKGRPVAYQRDGGDEPGAEDDEYTKSPHELLHGKLLSADGKKELRTLYFLNLL